MLFQSIRSRMIGYLCLLPGTQLARQKMIRGTIADENNLPLPGAAIKLYQLPDSQLRGSTLSTADGTFALPAPQEGAWSIQVTALGYGIYRSERLLLLPSDTSGPSLQVQMSATATALQAVTISARQEAIEREPGRVVLHPGRMLTAGNAWEALEQAPGVQTGNDRLSIKGKDHVVIWIDDRPVTMDETALADYLKNLPSGLLDRIEIIAQPPAQYDATGNGGLIRIYLKKGKAKGLNGTLQSENIQGRCTRLLQNATANFSTGRLNIYANGSNYNGDGIADITTERRYGKNEAQQLHQQTTARTHMDRVMGTLGAEWIPSKRDRWSATASYMYRKLRQNTTGEGLQQGTVSDTLTQVQNGNNSRTVNQDYGFSYSHSWDTSGRVVQLRADYTAYDQEQSPLNETRFRPQGYEATSREALSGNTNAEIKVYALKADMAWPFAGRHRLEGGVKAGWSRNRYTAAYLMDNDGNTLRTSGSFRYNESIMAAYLDYRTILNKWSLQLGLRLEHTATTGSADSSATATSRRYLNAFPAVFLGYAIDNSSRHCLQLSYNRRIDRPDYTDLNPFAWPQDRYTYRAGDAGLLPCLSDNLELAYLLKDGCSVTLSYSRIQNDIGTVVVPVADRVYLQAANTGIVDRWGCLLEGTLKLRPWWQLRPSLMLQYISSHNAPEWGGGAWYGGYAVLNATRQIFLGTWTAELFTEYNTRQPYAQYEDAPVWYMHAGISKKLWKDKVNIRLNVRDLWHTRIDRQDYRRTPGVEGYTSRIRDTRSVTLLLSYKFSSGRKNENASTTMPGHEAQQRIKEE